MRPSGPRTPPPLPASMTPAVHWEQRVIKKGPLNCPKALKMDPVGSKWSISVLICRHLAWSLRAEGPDRCSTGRLHLRRKGRVAATGCSFWRIQVRILCWCVDDMHFSIKDINICIQSALETHWKLTLSLKTLVQIDSTVS